MPLNPPLLTATMFASLQTQLQTNFPEVLADPVAAANQIKLANAIATAVALDVILHFQINALVNTLVNGITGTGPLGGPFPIVAQPGVGIIL